jgi:hypothetical protein
VVEAFEVEVDPHLAAPRLTQQPCQVTRQAADDGHHLAQTMLAALEQGSGHETLGDYALHEGREVLDHGELGIELLS